MELNEINLLQEPVLFLLSQEKINDTEGMSEFAPASKGNQNGGIKFGTQNLALVLPSILPSLGFESGEDLTAVLY